jgi:SEC-C motif
LASAKWPVSLLKDLQLIAGSLHRFSGSLHKSWKLLNVLRPIKMKDARAFLGRELSWLEEHYTRLCDFVHPFMWGQRTAGSYAGDSHIARSVGGGGFVMPDNQRILEYKFPVTEAVLRAVHQTASRALDNTRGIFNAINAFPRSPFTEAELIAKTGSSIGFKSLSRNARCPCRSGKKYRNCHGAVALAV